MLKMIIFSFRKHQNNRKNPSEISIFRLKYTYIGTFFISKNNPATISEEINGIKTSYFYQYEYDNQGNWGKYIEFEDEIPVMMTEREIVYY